MKNSRGYYFILFTSVLLAAIACTKEDNVPTGLVINELMPKNTSTVSDNAGEYDDWIELYNNTTEEIDLSGYFLSDNSSNVSMWAFPVGTKIAAKSYLIVWADDDTEQLGLHTNFKLSADGEEVILSSPEMVPIDKVKFSGQAAEFSYARKPNGTGNFNWGEPTFNSGN
jgi:hypothetical protein